MGMREAAHVRGTARGAGAGSGARVPGDPKLGIPGQPWSHVFSFLCAMLVRSCGRCPCRPSIGEPSPFSGSCVVLQGAPFRMNQALTWAR